MVRKVQKEQLLLICLDFLTHFYTTTGLHFFYQRLKRKIITNRGNFDIKKISLSSLRQQLDSPKNPNFAIFIENSRFLSSCFCLFAGLISSIEVSMKSYKILKDDQIEKMLHLIFASESW